jgi:hypothetical protein
MPAVARQIRAPGRVDPARVLRTALTSPLVNQEKLR